jgi:hypothetical protein
MDATALALTLCTVTAIVGTVLFAFSPTLEMKRRQHGKTDEEKLVIKKEFVKTHSLLIGFFSVAHLCDKILLEPLSIILTLSIGVGIGSIGESLVLLIIVRAIFAVISLRYLHPKEMTRTTNVTLIVIGLFLELAPVAYLWYITFIAYTA